MSLVLLARFLPERPILFEDLLHLTADEDERGRPLGMGRREHHREGGALAYAHEDRTFGAHGVHHGADVVHSLFERPDGRVIGQAHSALVEEDQARETGEPLHEAAVAGQLPVRLEVREPPMTKTRSTSPSPNTW